MRIRSWIVATVVLTLAFAATVWAQCTAGEGNTSWGFSGARAGGSFYNLSAQFTDVLKCPGTPQGCPPMSPPCAWGFQGWIEDYDDLEEDWDDLSSTIDSPGEYQYSLICNTNTFNYSNNTWVNKSVIAGTYRWTLQEIVPPGTWAGNSLKNPFQGWSGGSLEWTHQIETTVP